jgi:hypothetical protein
MGINATTAFGQTTPAVTELAQNTASTIETMLAGLVEAAKAKGELAQTLDSMTAAAFLYATLQGLTVRAQAGASRDELAAVADFTMNALTAM